MEPIVRDRQMQTLHLNLTRAAASDAHILLLGETGVGKEVFAQKIHRSSDRRKGPFLSINCSALVDSLLEAELFGYEAGAFTGASRAKPGLIESAHGGTLFLDEIGDMPPLHQAKLLRVIEEQQVLRVGSVEKRSVDVRFVSATNAEIQRCIKQGQFRADLFYRLAGITFNIPPLRKRRSEIVFLAEAFLEECARHHHRRPVPRLSDDAITALMQHNWPGNVRELRNVMNGLVVMCPHDFILPEHLNLEEAAVLSIQSGDTVEPSLPRLRVRDTETERDLMQLALKRCGGNQTAAAALLGISRRTMVNRMQQYDFPRPRRPGI